MTGRTPSRTCIYGVEQHILCHPTPNKVGGCTGAEFGIGNATQNKGYNTGFFGKWHMGMSDDFATMVAILGLARGEREREMGGQSLCCPDRCLPSDIVPDPRVQGRCETTRQTATARWMARATPARCRGVQTPRWFVARAVMATSWSRTPTTSDSTNGSPPPSAGHQAPRTAGVRRRRQSVGPFLAHFSAPHRPMRTA